MRRAAVRLLFVMGVLAVAAFVSLLAGRGAGNLSPEPALARAAVRTAATGSFRVAITYGEQDGSGRGQGEVDISRSRGTFDWQFQGTGGGESFRVRFVYEENVSWFALDNFEAHLTGAKAWLEIRADDDRDSVGGFLQPLASPAELLEFLEATSSDVQLLGSEEVRAVRSEHYRGMVDLEKAVAQAVGRHREALQSELDWRREEGERTTVQIEAWIDADGIARRIRFPENSVSEWSGLTVEYYDFGIDVVVERPPPADTMTEAEYLKLLEVAAQACRDGYSDESAALVCMSQSVEFGE